MIELGELVVLGVIGFVDGLVLENFGLLWWVLEYLKFLNKFVVLFCKNFGLVGNGVMWEGYDFICLGLFGVLIMVEIFVLVVVLELVDVIGILVYIMWVFIVWSVELIVNVKSRGLFIIVSMIWMYLLLDSLVIEGKFFLDNYFFFYDLNLCLEFFLGS